MRESQAIIERIRRVNEHYHHLDLSVDEWLCQIKPGQSLLARVTDSWDPYLREHWWPVAVGPNRLTIERPASARYEPGQVVSVLGWWLANDMTYSAEELAQMINQLTLPGLKEVFGV